MRTKNKFSDSKLIKDRIHYDPFADAKAKAKRLPVIQIPAAFWGGLQPELVKITPASGSPLPKADVLVITWTTVEAEALSAVFTSNHDFKATWFSYKHKSASILKDVPAGVINEKANSDTLKIGVIGFFTMVTFNGKKVLLFKSELHPADDGIKLPVIALVTQIALEAKPSLVITTGTAGAIGKNLEAADAVITSGSRFFLISPKSYAAFPGITGSVTFSGLMGLTFKKNYITKCNAQVTNLVRGTITDICKTAGYPLPNRDPQIFYNNVPGTTFFDAVSSNKFSMDDVADTDGLQELGIFNEMNDAFVSFALSQNSMTKKIPWLAIRNMSEPQSPNLLSATKTKWSDMYKAIGFYTTYNSAFACWAVISGLT
jgi:hypothetical protein